MSDRIPVNAKRIEFARVRQAMQVLGLMDDPSMIESVTIDPQYVTVALIKAEGVNVWRTEDVYYIDRPRKVTDQ